MLENFPYDIVGGNLFRLGFVGENDPVTEYIGPDNLHIFRDQSRAEMMYSMPFAVNVPCARVQE